MPTLEQQSDAEATPTPAPTDEGWWGTLSGAPAPVPSTDTPTESANVETRYEISCDGRSVLSVTGSARGDDASIEWTQPLADGGQQVVRLDWSIAHIPDYLDGTTAGVRGRLTLLGQTVDVLIRNGVLYDAATGEPITAGPDSPLAQVTLAVPQPGPGTDRGWNLDPLRLANPHVLTSTIGCVADFTGAAAGLGGAIGLVAGGGLTPAAVPTAAVGAAFGAFVGTGFGTGWCAAAAMSGEFGDRDLTAPDDALVGADPYLPVMPSGRTTSRDLSPDHVESTTGVFHVDLRGLGLSASAEGDIASAIRQATLGELAKIDMAPPYAVGNLDQLPVDRRTLPTSTSGLVAKPIPDSGLLS